MAKQIDADEMRDVLGVASDAAETVQAVPTESNQQVARQAVQSPQNTGKGLGDIVTEALEKDYVQKFLTQLGQRLMEENEQGRDPTHKNPNQVESSAEQPQQQQQQRGNDSMSNDPTQPDQQAQQPRQQQITPYEGFMLIIDAVDVERVVELLEDEVPEEWQDKTLSEIADAYHDYGAMQGMIDSYIKDQIGKRVEECVPQDG